MALSLPLRKKDGLLREQALEEAKRLEAEQEPVKDVVKVYKDGMDAAEKLKKYLKPAWFVKDDDPAARKAAKKPAKRAR
jgi:hypothetical protein